MSNRFFKIFKMETKSIYSVMEDTILKLKLPMAYRIGLEIDYYFFTVYYFIYIKLDSFFN